MAHIFKSDQTTGIAWNVSTVPQAQNLMLPFSRNFRRNNGRACCIKERQIKDRVGFSLKGETGHAGENSIEKGQPRLGENVTTERKKDERERNDDDEKMALIFKILRLFPNSFTILQQRMAVLSGDEGLRKLPNSRSSWCAISSCKNKKNITICTFDTHKHQQPAERMMLVSQIPRRNLSLFFFIFFAGRILNITWRYSCGIEG